jgi:DNA-binding winged helix-turn-helix (wHTH) protein/tetratricopeptide (TPR) repeat protein
MPMEGRQADERWQVDWTNEYLWHGDEMVHLSPKAFAVLRLLIEQAGQLVTKETLLETIWPDAVVTEAVLTVCIGELRKALRETARAPRFIQTVHRRGYRCIGHLPTVDPSPHPPASLASPRATSPTPLLIGRERELASLHQCLERVRQSARQTVFLTGEPGMGKTTIVNAFVEALERAGDVWLGRGQCIEHYGVSEAYLPVLEALGRLCREPGGAALLPVLEQHAPTWLVQMPSLLSATAFATVQRRVLGATQERMVRELAEAVEVLTVSRPLVLVLEDLHWSDYATLDLMAYLARRTGSARLLLLGTYRPGEVLLRGHPLQTVKQELVLHRQAVELPLDLLTTTEVAQYVALRGAGGADLPAAALRLAQLLSQRTDGHPLFLVQVVEHLLQRGVLGDGAGPWQVPPEALTAAMEIPTSVRDLIQLQFERLSPEEQRVLEAASVAGSACTAAAVAAGLDLALEAVEERCTGLAQRHQFLAASGIETWPDGTVTERYSWQHAVHQEVVYTRVPEGRRLRLHRRIGVCEETGYGAQAHEHAAELAVHFVRGQDTPRAVQYLQQAAENAARRHAHQEVMALVRQGLALLATLPETPARVQQELDLQIALGSALIATKGSAAPEVEQTYARAHVLCQQVGDTSTLFPTVRGLCRFYRNRGALPTARELGEQLLELAQRDAVPTHLLEAHEALGQASLSLGDYVAALAHGEQGITYIDSAAQQVRGLSQGPAPEVGCLGMAVQALWCLGYPAQALQRSQEALALAQAHPYSLVWARANAARRHGRRRDLPAVQAQAAALVALATAQAFPLWVGYGTCWRGWALAHAGAQHHGPGSDPSGPGSHPGHGTDATAAALPGATRRSGGAHRARRGGTERTGRGVRGVPS